MPPVHSPGEQEPHRESPENGKADKTHDDDQHWTARVTLASASEDSEDFMPFSLIRHRAHALSVPAGRANVISHQG